MSTQSTAARILAAQRNMQGNSIICTKCGSEHFYEVQVTRYRSGGSGSVEILANTDDQVLPLLKCAGCGYPVLPKVATSRRHGGVFESAHKEFRMSIIKGQTFLDAQNPDDIKSDVLQAAAGKHVEGAVNDLRDRVNNLESVQGSADHADVDEAAPVEAPTNEVPKTRRQK